MIEAAESQVKRNVADGGGKYPGRDFIAAPLRYWDALDNLDALDSRGRPKGRPLR